LIGPWRPVKPGRVDLRRGKDGLKLIDIAEEKPNTDNGGLQNNTDQANQNSSSDFAAQLDRLHTFINSKILEGSHRLQIARLEEAIKVLTVLLAGWEEDAKKKDLGVPTTLLAGQAAETGRFRLHG